MSFTGTSPWHLHTHSQCGRDSTDVNVPH